MSATIYHSTRRHTRPVENPKRRINKSYLCVEWRSFRAPADGQCDVCGGERRCHNERHGLWYRHHCVYRQEEGEERQRSGRPSQSYGPRPENTGHRNGHPEGCQVGAQETWTLCSRKHPQSRHRHADEYQQRHESYLHRRTPICHKNSLALQSVHISRHFRLPTRCRWDMQIWAAVLYRRFGTTYRSHLRESRGPTSWPLKMGRQVFPKRR
jgi:hypothetical protein